MRDPSELTAWDVWGRKTAAAKWNAICEFHHSNETWEIVSGIIDVADDYALHSLHKWLDARARLLDIPDKLIERDGYPE